ncbi:MAG: DUF975 family protein [Lachnospiraceae bacterium]|nr:DUF975 family protein [Lachnospiraceae bacterium]
MLNIAELKEKGKASMKANYWMSVVVSILLSFFAAGMSFGSGSSWNNNENVDIQLTDEVIAIILAVLAVIAVFVIIGALVRIFVFNPIEVGCQNFFIKNARTQNAQFGEVGAAFKPAWMNNVKTLFLRDLFLVLWSMLFLIPGLVKSYSYRMVPYILADHPEISGTEAISLSRKMMNGNKMKTFLFDLSFIGWILLSIITLGILAVFYVGPYYNNAAAEIYETLKPDFPELNS